MTAPCDHDLWLRRICATATEYVDAPSSDAMIGLVRAVDGYRVAKGQPTGAKWGTR